MKSRVTAFRTLQSEDVKENASRGADRDPLLRIDRYLEPTRRSSLADDVRRGLAQPQKSVPCKYFYDDRGSRLFDQICDLPEYYPTRTEDALLRQCADEIVALVRPSDVIELGSGASRKTRVLLDACTRGGAPLTYIPMDVSESMLRRSAVALRAAYPELRVHAIVGDYEQHLERIPSGRRRLLVFLGGTIGNFRREQAVVFVRAVRRQLSPGDFVLIGMDLVKPVDILNAAYNDAAGVTAEFNRNVLHVINRDLGGDFDPAAFAHLAFFNGEESQIEMHLRAEGEQQVRIAALDLQVSVAAGETIHTEISRKFSRAEALSLFAAARCRIERWYTPENQWFALALARVED